MLLICVSGYAEINMAAGTQQTRPTAPAFELFDMRGELHRLSDNKGKIVIVNFWAVWCAPCRKEIPSMNRALKALENENIELLAINVGDEKEAIEAFRNEYSMNFPVLMDKSGVVSQLWQVTAFPLTFIINAQGQIVDRIVGAREWDEIDMLDSLRLFARN